jgi:hypothetical protein
MSLHNIMHNILHRTRSAIYKVISPQMETSHAQITAEARVVPAIALNFLAGKEVEN